MECEHEGHAQASQPLSLHIQQTGQAPGRAWEREGGRESAVGTVGCSQLITVGGLISQALLLVVCSEALPSETCTPSRGLAGSAWTSIPPCHWQRPGAVAYLDTLPQSFFLR
jgi:hypothetical protein